jgi:hypothetical protein
MWVMIDDNCELEIVKIINVSGDTLTDTSNNKYNIEKAKYIWKKGVPMDNPEYIQRHLLEEENGN